jgi:structure-specific recognition protein 1
MSLSKAGTGERRTSEVRAAVSCALYISVSNALATAEQLAFLISNKLIFELQLNNVNNSNIAGRTEVSLEFHPSSKKPAKGQADEMVEIRFFVPGQASKARGSDAGSDAEIEEDEEVSAAQAFHDAVKEKAELGRATGNMIISFEEVLITTPRGRYDVDMFPDFLRLRGKTYDYKIAYSSISKLFLLPKDDMRILFVVRATRGRMI